VLTLAAIMLAGLGAAVACGAERAPPQAEHLPITPPIDAAEPAKPDDPSPPDDPTRPDAPAAPTGPRTVFVHLFEWRWDDIALECEQFLGPKGFAAVQVSPPQEHATFASHTWWQRYQPVSYALTSRSGDRTAFADMVARCKAAGVDIYVDAVMNHMSFLESGTGSGGTMFSKYAYPGLYGEEHFHSCGQGITDYGSLYQLHECELATCADLDTGNAHVRATLAAYLQDLVDLGVAGIRLDGAKHISIGDIQAILGLVRGELYVYQEVIDYDGSGPVTSSAHAAIGDVTEFRYGADLSHAFRSGDLASLSTFGEPWGYLPSHAGIAFIDNHDNQRGHGSGDPITHGTPELYRLTAVFMLAFPYGYPQIMSSYAFTGPDEGPPSDAAGHTLHAIVPDATSCAPGWICEHRWPALARMVGFRNATSDAFILTDWWDNGGNQVAFGRGELGFVAINRDEASPLTGTFQTSMVPGRYCDVVGGELEDGACTGVEVIVAADGKAEIVAAPLDAIAIHAGSRWAD
jgi:alpha-amylase